MEDPAVEAFTQQLNTNPDDWYIRAHLAGLLEVRGDHHQAAEVIMTAPTMPQAREHILAAVRILTPVNPAASLPYLQLLGQSGESASTGGFPAAVAPMAAPIEMAMPVVVAASTDYPGPAATVPAHSSPVWKAPPPELLSGDIHLTEFPKQRFGARRFAFVVGLHVAFLAAAAYWVISKQTIRGKDELKFDAQPPRVSATRGTETAVKMAKKRSSSSAPSAAKRLLSKSSTSSIVLPEIKTTSALTDVSNLFASGMGGVGLGTGTGGTGGDGTGGMGIGGGRGRFVGPLSMESRCSKGDRDKRIAAAGGLPETDEHVIKSLTWLKTKQNADGSWGGANRAAMTGLTLLAFLGHCETPDSSKEYGESVLKGITWMVNLWLQKEFLSENDPKSNGAPYEHGIGTYALGEAYSMTRYGTKRIPNLRESVIGAIDVIIKGQDSEGGWNYGYGPPQGGGSDMSVSGWQIQAMNAARHSGMDFEGMGDCFKKAMKYVENSQSANGAFGYRGQSGARYGMTGIASLALIVGGRERSGELRRGADFIKDTWSKRRSPFVYDTEESELYCSYYVNQVSFMRGGAMWRAWNKALQDELLPNQNPDGSYKREGGAEGPHGSGAAGGDADLYRTALCTLMLEVYYRYLPATEMHTGTGGD